MDWLVIRQQHSQTWRMRSSHFEGDIFRSADQRNTNFQNFGQNDVTCGSWKSWDVLWVKIVYVFLQKWSKMPFRFRIFLFFFPEMHVIPGAFSIPFPKTPRTSCFADAFWGVYKQNWRSFNRTRCYSQLWCQHPGLTARYWRVSWNASRVWNSSFEPYRAQDGQGVICREL